MHRPLWHSCLLPRENSRCDRFSAKKSKLEKKNPMSNGWFDDLLDRARWFGDAASAKQIFSMPAMQALFPTACNVYLQKLEAEFGKDIPLPRQIHVDPPKDIPLPSRPKPVPTKEETGKGCTRLEIFDSMIHSAYSLPYGHGRYRLVVGPIPSPPEPATIYVTAVDVMTDGSYVQVDDIDRHSLLAIHGVSRACWMMHPDLTVTYPDGRRF